MPLIDASAQVILALAALVNAVGTTIALIITARHGQRGGRAEPHAGEKPPSSEVFGG